MSNNYNEVVFNGCVDGLTKLEYFTAAAMQGILAGWDKPDCEFDPQAVSNRAVTVAKATLDALAKEG